MISILIPVKDGGSDLVRCLEAIARQRVDDEVEVVVVDSGSSDGSPDRARALGARVHEIAAYEFNHGRTRNLAAELARGDVLVFTTQDAYAADERWLERLVAPLADPQVAGVYGRQLPHEDARPPERYFLDFLYGPNGRVQQVLDPSRLTYEHTLFSNVNSAIPQRIWREFPFAEDLPMSEDQEWSRRVLLAGKTIVYEARAAVYHSHRYSIAGAFRRFFDSGATASRTYVGATRSSARALDRAAVVYARGELAWLWRTGRRRWIPYAAVYETAKLLGLQLGRRHERLPLALKRRLSTVPSAWSNDL
ncbi:MAG: rhamnosyltransferase [Gaiellaceae bacterium]|nr:MAG: rhamnosyltransferase [Gaiellaceae bacterium]